MGDSLPSGAAVRFLQPKLKGARPSELMGKGMVSVEESSLVFAGKKMLPLWVRVLVVVVAAAAGIPLLGMTWPIAVAILIFGRVRHRESWPAAAVQSVAYEAGRGRFLVTAKVGPAAQCVAWQTRGDPAPLAEALRRQFGGAFREEAVRGWKTY